MQETLAPLADPAAVLVLAADHGIAAEGVSAYPQEVTGQKQGFESQVRRGIVLTVGQHAVANFKLELGDVVQQLTVSEDAPIVNTTTASTAGSPSSCTGGGCSRCGPTVSDGEQRSLHTGSVSTR